MEIQKLSPWIVPHFVVADEAEVVEPSPSFFISCEPAFTLLTWNYEEARPEAYLSSGYFSTAFCSPVSTIRLFVPSCAHSKPTTQPTGDPQKSTIVDRNLTPYSAQPMEHIKKNSPPFLLQAEGYDVDTLIEQLGIES